MIRQPIEVVLFDLGGTLFHELGPWDGLYLRADEELWRVLHRAGVALGAHDVYGGDDTLFGVYTSRQSPDVAERTMGSFLDDLLHSKGVEIDEETLRAGLRAMYAVTRTNWRAEDDAIPTLQQLSRRGFRIGAVSNGSDDENTQALVDKSGVRPYLEFLISSAAFGRRKPDSGIFRLALDHFRIAPERAIMVGDNYEADVLGAHGVGMQAIWITRRVSPPLPEMAQGEPEAIVQTLSEIPPLLEAG